MKKLLAVLLCLLLLTACGPKEPQVLETPEPQPPAQTELQPQPAEPEEPSSLSYGWTDAPSAHSWDNNVRVSMVIPVFSGENQAALDIINQYYGLLQSKVLDYAEGDLTAAPEGRYVVNAEYCVHLATEEVLSVDWSIHTTEETQNTTRGEVRYFNFDPKTGKLITFCDIFRDADGARSAFVQRAREIMGRSADSHLYYEHIWELADSALDIDDFSYTETGLAVHYSADSVGLATAVELTWEELAAYLET